MHISLLYIITGCFVTLCLYKIGGTECPFECRCNDKAVNCYGAGLKTIPSNLPTNTVKLDLQSNEIESLDGKSFQGLMNLKEIKLRYNKLKTIDEDTFNGVTGLERLDVGTNLLKSLQRQVFTRLKNLTLVDVSENFLTNIDGIFNNLPNLQRLDLGGNMIKHISNTSFLGLKKVIHLILSKNTITHIDKKAMSPMKKLAFVLLSNNPLKNIDEVMTRNKKVSFLDLSKCQLEQIPRGLPARLRYFQLSQNNIQGISTEDLAPYTNMGILVLDKNNISFIEHDALMKMSLLRELWINANQLEKIPHIPAAVESLHMEMNKVVKIQTNDFPPESKLKILSLKGNLIESIDKNGLKNLERLTSLYLNDNKLKKIGSHVFANLVNLKRLELNKNKIKKIEKNAFDGMYSLKRLEMAFIEEETVIEDSNLLKNVPVLKLLDLQGSISIANFIFTSNTMSRSLSKLEDLNLMDCQLTTVSPVLYEYGNLKHLKLAGNHWHCDKRLKWLRDWIKFDDGILMFANHLVCYTPLYLKDRKIGSLRDAEFTIVTTTPTPTTQSITSDKSSEIIQSTDNSTLSSTMQQTVSTTISISTQTSKKDVNKSSTILTESEEKPTQHIKSASTDNKQTTLINNKNDLDDTHFTIKQSVSAQPKDFRDSMTTPGLSTQSKNSDILFTSTSTDKTSVLSRKEKTTIINRSTKTGSTVTLPQENTSENIITEKPTPEDNELTKARRARPTPGRKYSSYTTAPPIYNITISSTFYRGLQKQHLTTNTLIPTRSTMLTDEKWLEEHIKNFTTTATPTNFSTPKHINITYVDGIPVPEIVNPKVGESSTRNIQTETENVKIIVLVTALTILAIAALIIMAAFMRKRYSRKQRYQPAGVYSKKNGRKISMIEIDDENHEQVSTSDKASMTSHSLDGNQTMRDEPEQCLLDLS